MNKPIIANEILIRMMEVPIRNEREDAYGRRRRGREEEKKIAEESRRWEESAGKDKRQHTHTDKYIVERNEYYRRVGLCTDRVSISLLLPVFAFFFFFISPKAASVGQEPSLDCLGPGSSSLSLSSSPCNMVNAMIKTALGPTREMGLQDLSIEFRDNSVRGEVA